MCQNYSIMIIFDLDDTLYQNRRLSQRNTDLTKSWIKEELGLDEKELESMYEKLPEEYPNPLKGIKSLGLSTQEYYDNVFRRIEPAKYISENPKLEKGLKKLDREKVVISFASKDYCKEVLDVLGIEKHFEKVLSASQFESSKKRAYTNIKNPEIVIGDNYNADLKPAMELGIDIIHVDNKCDVYQNHHCFKDILAAIQFLRQK